MHKPSKTSGAILTPLYPSCLLLLFFILQSPVCAKENRIPEELHQWIPWVLYEQEANMCSLDSTNSNKRYCTWPTSLELKVEENGAEFRQEWLIETRTLVPLPGNSPLWPTKVQSDNKKVLVSSLHGKPAIWLDPGKHIITGKFSWQTLPENILIPPETGLVKLTLFQKEINNIQLDRQGKLWLRHKKKITQNNDESVSVQVFRKIVDGVPLTQQLRIQLIVSGSPRQITLGLKNESPFIPLQVNSPLPVRLDSSNRLQLQVRPGQWQISLTLRNSKASSPEKLTMGDIDGIWPTEEVWVFESDPKLRQVEVGSVTPVDPSRTSLPEDWKTLPAYLIKKNESMSISQKNRGNPNPVPNRLKLHRKIWLDVNGTGLTAYDTISGTMNRGWRLNVAPSQLLGKVDVDGTPRLITRLQGEKHSGVEVRQGRLNLHAESRLEATTSNGFLEIPALGWDHNFQNLSIELNLPPGWKLITTKGVDKVSTWVNKWTLLDIFLVLITGLATARVLGLLWGFVATTFLILSFHQTGAPLFLWLPLLAFLAIHKAITAEKAAQICRLASLGILLLIIIASIPYIIHEIRVGIYPQLEFGSYRPVVRDITRQRNVNQTFAPQAETLADATSVSSYKRSTSQTPHSLAKSQLPAKLKVAQVDPEEMIQTGPGLPDWEWERKTLQWNGPVSPSQSVSLLLLNPHTNTALAFLRVLLLIILTGGFLRHILQTQSFKNLKKKANLAAIIFCLLFPLNTITTQNVHAEIPRADILQELQKRLLAPPKCGTNCATINTCSIQIHDDILKVVLQVDSLVRGAIPLPGRGRLFDSITVDGKAAQILRTDSKGNILVRLEPGSHNIVLTKSLLNTNRLSFDFPLVPKFGEALVDKWSINGLYEDGRLAKQLSLTRTIPTMGAADTNKEESNDIRIPAFVRVERTLHLGLKWSVSTRIIRLSPGTVIALDIPLLDGERVTTEALNIQNRYIRINMGPDQRVFSFRSSLTPVDSFILSAMETPSWTEIWFLDVSPVWHAETRGIPEVNQTKPSGKRYPEYRPYPGESLALITSRPQGVQGPTMTVNRSKRIVTPGRRATETTLSFSLTASRGMQHSITLPPEIDLQKSLINGRELPLQLEQDNTLILPIKPGKQDITISWRSEQGIVTKFTTEPVNLGTESVNASIKMVVPSSRWILLTGGPRIGPAVLFWGELLAIIIIALLLGRIPFTPLNTLQWLLLSLGLSQVPSPVAAIVVAWLLLLGLRKKRGSEIRSITTFNTMQVLLVLLSFAAMGALFFTIQQGLLGHPDMQIGGNGSFQHTLRWYQDRSSSLLPSAWVISVPLLVYRISMLIWALWLAISLLHWLRWGWGCFTDTALWKKSPPKSALKKSVRKQRKVATSTTATPGRKARPTATARQATVSRKAPLNKAAKAAPANTKKPASQGG